MTAHLLVLSVGPIQEFISAARRTRDLWFGSQLLSDISRAVAVSVSQHGELIFPASTDAPNVANVILVKLRSGEDPAAIAAVAKTSAQKKWRQGFADQVFKEYQGVIRPEIWKDQVDDVVEFAAAWSPLNGKYQDVRARVMRLLAGRKNCRDFLPANGRPGIPKSSLDGLRESVLKDPEKERWPEKFRARLRIRDGEQLDVIGFVKRTWKPKDSETRYPSVSRVAADPWLRGHEGRLGAVIAECERLGNSVIRRLDVSPEYGHPHYAPFPYEGSAVFRNRHHEMIEEADLEPDDLRRLAEAVARLGEPNPYLAVIVADGDKMGETISKLDDDKNHRGFSAKLAEFAAAARATVHKYHGVLVYSGGDDVLAFVPVDQCLDCARELHDEFGEILQKWGEKAGTKITLSVGVAIGHFLENLEDLREHGKAAEKHAKTPDADGVKDALAVHLHKRGGSPIKVRGKWTDTKSEPEKWAEAPDTRITGLAVLLHKGLIPNRLATDLNRMADVYDKWPRKTDDEQQRVKAAIRGDILRVIAAKKPQGGGNIRELLRPILKGVIDAAALRQLAEELLIARQIATASRQADGGKKEGEV